MPRGCLWPWKPPLKGKSVMLEQNLWKEKKISAANLNNEATGCCWMLNNHVLLFLKMFTLCNVLLIRIHYTGFPWSSVLQQILKASLYERGRLLPAKQHSVSGQNQICCVASLSYQFCTPCCVDRMWMIWFKVCGQISEQQLTTLLQSSIWMLFLSTRAFGNFWITPAMLFMQYP